MYDRVEHIVIGQIGVRHDCGPVADHWTGLVKRILLVLAVLALAPLAQAQSDDKAYCAQLSDLYRRYVQNATGRRVDVEALAGAR